MYTSLIKYFIIHERNILISMVGTQLPNYIICLIDVVGGEWRQYTLGIYCIVVPSTEIFLNMKKIKIKRRLYFLKCKKILMF